MMFAIVITLPKKCASACSHEGCLLDLLLSFLYSNRPLRRPYSYTNVIVQPHIFYRVGHVFYLKVCPCHHQCHNIMTVISAHVNFFSRLIAYFSAAWIFSLCFKYPTVFKAFNWSDNVFGNAHVSRTLAPFSKPP